MQRAGVRQPTPLSTAAPHGWPSRAKLAQIPEMAPGGTHSLARQPATAVPLSTLPHRLPGPSRSNLWHVTPSQNKPFKVSQLPSSTHGLPKVEDVAAQAPAGVQEKP